MHARVQLCNQWNHSQHANAPSTTQLLSCLMFLTARMSEVPQKIHNFATQVSQICWVILTDDHRLRYEVSCGSCGSCVYWQGQYHITQVGTPSVYVNFHPLGYHYTLGYHDLNI